MDNLNERLENAQTKPWYFDGDYAMAGLFIVFLALCAADIV